MQSIFKRYEKKYLITVEQSIILQQIMSQYMVPDQHDEYLVQNLYYDTDRWDIVQTSINKPLYKEKMRLRCYGEAHHKSEFYLELKKKYKGIVYKRRITIPAQSLVNSSVHTVVSETQSQISRELDFYFRENEIAEKIYISYQRIAFVGKEAKELRVTFDADIRFRLGDLIFSNSTDGQHILSEDKMIMEIKTPVGMPLWMASALTENNIFPTAFSKFGICYTEHIYKHICEERTANICA